MDDLLAIDACVSSLGEPPEVLQEIVTPLHWETWDSKLLDHPDQRFRRYVVMVVITRWL